MTLFFYFSIIVLVVFADLFTKFLVKGSELLMAGGSIEVIPGVFRFRYVENPGAAMGSFAGNRWVFMVFSTVAIVAIVVFLLLKHKTVHKLLGVSLALVTGGGIGNMYERLFNQNARGQYVVTDFFDFYLFDFWKWVFNVADVAVCVGAGLMMLYLILDLIADYRARKHPERY
ncbi:MAG: signal peptidase II, partial [Clostridia bacterium]|nr:signal peptidase II [Clostridia bacterium]